MTWLNLGRVAAGAALVLCVLIQAINHDWFPPDVSVSQYGIGPAGWVFTLWTVTVAVAALTLQIGGVHGHGAIYWLVFGAFGLVLMGVVRTDADGLQHSWHARVHMIASIVALVALPIGMALGMNRTRDRWRTVAWSIVVASAFALIMVLFSALGASTPGMDAQHSWAFWQAIAVVLDMALLAEFALATMFDPRYPLPVRWARAMNPSGVPEK